MSLTVDFDHQTKAVTTPSAELLAAKSDRKYLLIQNTSAAIVYLGIGKAATVADGVKLDPEEAYEPSVVPSNQINVIGASAVNIITVEG